jgi:hypothetical protein
MQHAYMYNGGFERNFPALTPGATAFQTGTGTEVPIPPWPPEANGVHVAYMEKQGKKFFAVRLQFEEQDVVLGNPVAIDLERHLGNRRLSPRPTLVPDDLASALLDDAIARNPDQATELALLINRVNQVRRASR